jgi:hypothetical protein
MPPTPQHRVCTPCPQPSHLPSPPHSPFLPPASPLPLSLDAALTCFLERYTKSFGIDVPTDERILLGENSIEMSIVREMMRAPYAKLQVCVPPHGPPMDPSMPP